MYVENYLKMPDLKDGYLYKIIARNASYGIWTASHQGFVISRHKFGDNFLFEENHYDCDNFATAQPLEEIEQAPFTSLYEHEDEVLEYLNKFESIEV